MANNKKALKTKIGKYRYLEKYKKNKTSPKFSRLSIK